MRPETNDTDALRAKFPSKRAGQPLYRCASDAKAAREPSAQVKPKALGSRLIASLPSAAQRIAQSETAPLSKSQ